MLKAALLPPCRARCSHAGSGRPSAQQHIVCRSRIPSRLRHPSRPSLAGGAAGEAAAAAAAPAPAAAFTPPAASREQDIPGMAAYLDSLRWDSNGLVAVIAQHVDTGEVLMQAYADRAAVCETLQTGLATFYSRSRQERWCKGETSGHFIQVQGVFADCDKDSLVYLGDPIGPACHTGARTCWFNEVALVDGGVAAAGTHTSHAHTSPATTLIALERTIQERRVAMEADTGGKPSWTAKLLSNPALLCSKIREEAGELCQTLEASEGPERAASEMADLLYHSMVLLNCQGVHMEDVFRVLRQRFGTSGIAEKASRAPKQSS